MSETKTCQAITHRKVSRGIVAKGTESFRTEAQICGRKVADGRDICQHHINEGVKMEAKLAAKRAREAM
jgi:hypothetical protein